MVGSSDCLFKQSLCLGAGQLLKYEGAVHRDIEIPGFNFDRKPDQNGRVFFDKLY